jgi:gamma-resorcylate decarboxylase
MKLDKIALEEHWESPDFAATGDPKFIDELYFAEVQRRLKDVDQRIEDMDRCGIDISILSLTQPGIEGIANAKQAIEMARKMNDHVANKLVARHPKRLKAFACVPLQDPEAAAQELERAVTQLGCVGVLINGYSNVGDENTAQYLDESQVQPFWDRVSALKVPVYLHPRNPLPNQRRIYDGYAGLIGASWGFGVETATHSVRLMLSGLFDRYPDLTAILGHLGEGLTFTLPRLDHRLRHLKAVSHGPHKLPPTEYFRRNFCVTTSGVFRTQALINALLELGSDRILFSVDYPYETMQEISSWFDSCSIGETDREKIGNSNARRLFRL